MPCPPHSRCGCARTRWSERRRRCVSGRPPAASLTHEPDIDQTSGGEGSGTAVAQKCTARGARSGLAAAAAAVAGRDAAAAGRRAQRARRVRRRRERVRRRHGAEGGHGVRHRPRRRRARLAHERPAWGDPRHRRGPLPRPDARRGGPRASSDAPDGATRAGRPHAVGAGASRQAHRRQGHAGDLRGRSPAAAAADRRRRPPAHRRARRRRGHRRDRSQLPRRLPAPVPRATPVRMARRRSHRAGARRSGRAGRRDHAGRRLRVGRRLAAVARARAAGQLSGRRARVSPGDLGCGRPRRARRRRPVVAALHVDRRALADRARELRGRRHGPDARDRGPPGAGRAVLPVRQQLPEGDRRLRGARSGRPARRPRRPEGGDLRHPPPQRRGLGARHLADRCLGTRDDAGGGDRADRAGLHQLERDARLAQPAGSGQVRHRRRLRQQPPGSVAVRDRRDLRRRPRHDRRLRAGRLPRDRGPVAAGPARRRDRAPLLHQRHGAGPVDPQRPHADGGAGPEGRRALPRRRQRHRRGVQAGELPARRDGARQLEHAVVIPRLRLPARPPRRARLRGHEHLCPGGAR